MNKESQNSYTEKILITITGFLPWRSATTPQNIEVKALPIINDDPSIRNRSIFQKISSQIFNSSVILQKKIVFFDVYHIESDMQDIKRNNEWSL